MSFSPCFRHNLMDIGSLLRTILGTIPNYKRDPWVHWQGYIRGFIEGRLQQPVSLWRRKADDAGVLRGVRLRASGLGFRVYWFAVKEIKLSYPNMGVRFRV